MVTSSREMGGFHGSTDLNGIMLSKKRKMLIEEGVHFEDISEAKRKKGNYKVASDCVHHF